MDALDHYIVLCLDKVFDYIEPKLDFRVFFS